MIPATPNSSTSTLMTGISTEESPSVGLTLVLLGAPELTGVTGGASSIATFSSTRARASSASASLPAPESPSNGLGVLTGDVSTSTISTTTVSST